MIEIRITGIHKPAGAANQHSAISHYRWQDSTQVAIWERVTMVQWLLDNPSLHKAYVLDKRGNKAYCKVVRNQHGTVFLETYADGTLSDNLLSLPLI